MSEIDQGVREYLLAIPQHLRKKLSIKDVQDIRAPVQKQLDAANARVEWKPVSEEPPGKQLVFIEMIMPSGERRFDMMLGECIDDALYVTRWTPAPTEWTDEAHADNTDAPYIVEGDYCLMHPHQKISRDAPCAICSNKPLYATVACPNCAEPNPGYETACLKCDEPLGEPSTRRIG